MLFVIRTEASLDGACGIRGLPVSDAPYFVALHTGYSLNTAIFSKLSNDNDLPGNFLMGIKALDVNDYLIYENVSGALYYDADGSGKGVAIQFVQLTGVTTLEVTDIVLM